MSALTFLNRTPYPAQFTVRKGEQVVACLPSVPSGGQIRVPSDGVDTVTDSTIADSMDEETLAVGSPYFVSAIVNGVTTETVQTANANAVITVTRDDSALVGGYYRLEVA
jgi:hypothetical protein